MKKKAVYIFIITVLCVASAFVFAACGKGGRTYESTYYGTYGEWFSLPYADSVSVTDADGNAVKVVDGKIFLDRAGNYTLRFTNGKSKKKATLSVSAGREAAIFPSQKIVYTVVGQKADLVTATASDGVRACAVEGKMFYGDEEIDVTEGFTPTEVGVYDYVLTAVTGSGVRTELTIPYYVEERDNFSDKIASFDKPHGLTQMGFSTRRLSYSQDVAFSGEDGTVALNISSGVIGGSTDFCIYNLECPNVTRYDSIYFYVYNPTPNNLQFFVGWKKAFGLKPKSWTRVNVDKDEYDTVLPGTYPSSMENITARDINGLFFSVLLQRDSFVRRGDCLYFSAMRGIKAVDVKTLQATIDAIGADEIDQLTVETIDFYYNSLRDTQKAQVRGYGAIKNVYEKNRAIEAGLDYRPDKLTYYDTAYGVSQVTPIYNVRSVETDKEMTFNGQPTLKITSASSDFVFAIKDPFVFDLSEFDVVEVAIYNPTDVTLVYYNNDPSYPGIGTADYDLLPHRWNRYLLPVCDDKTVNGKSVWIRPSDWYGDGVMVGKDFYVAPIYAHTMETVFDTFLENSIEDGGYIRSMFTEYIALPSEKKEALKDKMCDVYKHLLGQVTDVAAQETYALSILNIYTLFDAETQTLLAAQPAFTESFAALYGACVDFVLDRGAFALHKESVWQLLSVGRVAPSGCAAAYNAFVSGTVTLTAGDKVIPFGEALDDETIKEYMHELGDRASAEYTTDKHYGDDVGSTVYTYTEEDGYCNFSVNVGDVFFTGEETLEFYVYYECADPTFQPTFMYRYYPFSTAGGENYNAGTLKVGDWTKITVPLSGQVQVKDWIFIVSRNWDNLHQGDRMYFSSVRIV